ncbi:hypothetical protein J2Z42_002054 [Clostridium algifaecis]|uniref:Uncharacterized protein n=1 Tax=Clostridium algifaecis TaxID=1472040 RepID=A0ABS4KVD2_9CLOT|nr:hypothetical protein [Clostridium algifaecis]MBP2033351.1 hypothetical protein [Clostridium algifaecis]
MDKDELNIYLNKKEGSKIEGFIVEVEHSLKTFLEDWSKSR